MRNLVMRLDGKLVNAGRKRGQLFVCATGCCCGLTERGFAPVPTEIYHTEWERRRLRNKVHLSIGGCLGPCPLANVALLLFDGRPIWLHSLNDEQLILHLYDYIDAMLAADGYLPPPPTLADHVFNGFSWSGEGHAAGASSSPPSSDRSLAEPGILFLTHADTDLLTLNQVLPQLPPDFPTVRAANPGYLKTTADLAAFLERELRDVELVILRLLGGRASFADGIERLVAHAQQHGTWLLCLPGTDMLDPELTALSNVGVPIAHEAFAYLQMGGAANYEQLLRFLSDHLLTTGFGYDPPQQQPRHGLYHPQLPGVTLEQLLQRHQPGRPTLGLLFYRSHLLAGNTDFVDAIVRAAEARGANVIPVYAYSLKDGQEEDQTLPEPLRYFLDEHDAARIDVLLSTMSFALGTINPEGPTLSSWGAAPLARLNVPVIQAITAGTSAAQWRASLRGLSPIDTAMNVAIPEFDGRIIGVPISFKETVQACGCSSHGTSVVRYVPAADRVDRTVGMALRLAALRMKPNAAKRIAFVLTNSPTKAARIGNAVGLDAPASLLAILDAMRAAGYNVGNPPQSGDELLHALIDRCSYDVEWLSEQQLRQAAAQVPAEEYDAWFAELPERNRREMQERWGPPPGAAYVHDGRLSLAGLEFGNVFIALQPPRGYGMDPNAIYHLPDLPPTHNYYALYRWLRDAWGADAIVHLGKHGTLEWLPGKGVGMSETCYPDQFLGDVPLIYPFIINNPGEGTQAKRRAHAVIVDHMVPPMTSAGAYGELAELAQLVDEYYQVEQLDPAKLPILQQQIWELLQRANLTSDLALILRRDHGDHVHEWDDEMTEDGTPAAFEEMGGRDFAHLLEDIDGYLCELTGAQIRGGLHILGQVPREKQLVDLLACLTRLPNLHVPGLRAGVAAAYGLSLDELLEQPGRRLARPVPRLEAALERPIISAADALEAIDALCLRLLATLAREQFDVERIPAALQEVLGTDQPAAADGVATTLRFICGELLPNLQRCTEEIANLLQALDGGYVPPGPSGAPTRGMAHVLPTGRNFYALDPRTVPSQAAWQVGQTLASQLIERYLREEGRYPESVGISIWGTSAMRTHGDDLAQVFALLGVRPRWQTENRRLLGVEVIPLEDLGRPRIDVICRISGFFRDAFPHLIALLDEAVQAVAELDEPPEHNYLRKHALADEQRYQQAGHSAEEAAEQARYRIFGSKPGTYGAGILPLIDERNWRDAGDFTEAYINWGGYAYTARRYGVDARQPFRAALSGVSVAIKNQDNREHDVFDSDDYLQYHGGMIAAIRALSGRQPRRYFGDTADPARVQVRDLREEALRVFRSRVVNPRWIESMQRHGYKGALEMTATVDYIFGYDATADVVEDWMYEKLALTYALDPQIQRFFERSNPWALRDITTRLLEAADRGMWSRPNQRVLEQLRQAYLRTEGELEGRSH